MFEMVAVIFFSRESVLKELRDDTASTVISETIATAMLTSTKVKPLNSLIGGLFIHIL